MVNDGLRRRILGTCYDIVPDCEPGRLVGR